MVEHKAVCNSCETEAVVMHKTALTISYRCPSEECETTAETQPRLWVGLLSASTTGVGVGLIYGSMIGAFVFAAVWLVILLYGPTMINRLEMEVSEA